MKTKEIDRGQLEKRIEDWESRIQGLYRDIEKWLGDEPEYSVRRKGHVCMYEELMDQFNIPEKQMPVLEIIKEGKPAATFKPKGLWVIGANGRIDIFSKSGSYILVDRSAEFETPEWQVYSSGDKKSGECFTKDFLGSILEAA